MISVGVRDLKNQLSRYLQYVKRGESVLITEHNRIIAEISLHQEGQKEGQKSPGIEERLENLAVSGKLQKAKRNKAMASSSHHEGENTINWVSIYQNNRSDT